MAAIALLSKELNDQDTASSVGSFLPMVSGPCGDNDLEN